VDMQVDANPRVFGRFLYFQSIPPKENSGRSKDIKFATRRRPQRGMLLGEM
jgi:hypothetical protein